MSIKADKTAELAELERLQLHMGAVLKRALTNDPPLASTLGQSWLIQLAEASELESVNVISFPMQHAGNQFDKLMLSIQAAGSQQSILLFLYRLSESDLEHRLVEWKLEPLEPVQLHLSLQVEILCTAQGRREAVPLPVDLELPAPWQELDSQLVLLPVTQPPLPTTPLIEEASAPNAPVRRVQLVGIVTDGNNSHALFVDTTSHKEFKRTGGSRLAPEHGIETIQEIRVRSVTLQTPAGQKEVQLGEFIAIGGNP